MLVFTVALYIRGDRLARRQSLNRALIAAIKRSDTDAVEALLAAGANPEAKGPSQVTPILSLCKKLMERRSEACGS
jgi:hypothetical protein